MTLLLPLLDYARSYRALVQRIALHVPRDACLAAPGLGPTQVAALESFGRYRVDARAGAAAGSCEWLLLETRSASATPPAPPAGWELVARERRPTDRDEVTSVFRRAPAS